MSSYGIWLSAAGMKVNDYRQELLANNIANGNTTGFKRDLELVTQRQVESLASPWGRRFAQPVLDGMSGGANVRPTFHDFAQGAIELTGRPLDVAIDGDGFFTVSDGTATRYTRDGEFTLSADGALVLAAGGGRWKVLSDSGSSITINDSLGGATVSADGTVRQGNLAVAKLGIATTDDKSTLRKVGENLFETSEEMTPITSRVVPEARESSNFDVMGGLATMIEAARAYQLNATMIQLQDQITGAAVSRVASAA